MTLTTLNGFPTLFRDLDDFFPRHSAERVTAPTADISESERQLEIHLDLPGVKADDIEVKLEGTSLTITAQRKADDIDDSRTWVRRERRFGTWARTFTLPSTMAGTQPEAAFHNGVLTLTLPKPQAVLPRTIKVKQVS